jgi:hypothetical protein
MNIDGSGFKVIHSFTSTFANSDANGLNTVTNPISVVQQFFRLAQ